MQPAAIIEGAAQLSRSFGATNEPQDDKQETYELFPNPALFQLHAADEIGDAIDALLAAPSL